MTPTVAVLVAVGLLVVVPLGLPLLRTRGGRRLARAWPLAAVPAVVATVLPQGAGAALLAAPVAALGLVGAGLGLRRAVGARTADWRLELLALSALLGPAVAGAFLVADRLGTTALPFEPEIVALTVPHFLYAGFAVPVVAAVALAALPGRLTRSAAVLLPAGTAVVATGHLAGRAVELAGAVLVAAGVLCLSAALLRDPRPVPPAARRLLVVAAAVTPLTMTLAVWWAVGRLTGLPHLGLGATAATHGVGNALGLCLCGLLGWRLLHPRPV